MLTRRAFLTAAGFAPLACVSRMGAARYDLINIDGKRTGHRKLVASAVVMNGKKVG